jgi:FolB domain-containing protein
MKVTDIVALNDLRVECIIGVYPHERIHPQWLVMEIELALDTRAVYTGAGLAGTVDYARLAGELRFILEASRFRMLEQAAEAVARYVLVPPPPDPHSSSETGRAPGSRGAACHHSTSCRRVRISHSFYFFWKRDHPF